MAGKRWLDMSIDKEIKRYESIHPSIYELFELCDQVDSLRTITRRDRLSKVKFDMQKLVYALEDIFVNSPEWTLSRTIDDARISVFGTIDSGKSSLVHRYIQGNFREDKSIGECGRLKKIEVVKDRRVLVMIRHEELVDDEFIYWCDTIVLVFSLYSGESLIRCLEAYRYITGTHRSARQLSFIVAATKDEKPTRPSLPKSKITEILKAMNDPVYMEACAFDGTNVDNLFQVACMQALAHKSKSLAGIPGMKFCMSPTSTGSSRNGYNRTTAISTSASVNDVPNTMASMYAEGIGGRQHLSRLVIDKHKDRRRRNQQQQQQQQQQLDNDQHHGSSYSSFLSTSTISRSVSSYNTGDGERGFGSHDDDDDSVVGRIGDVPRAASVIIDKTSMMTTTTMKNNGIDASHRNTCHLPDINEYTDHFSNMSAKASAGDSSNLPTRQNKGFLRAAQSRLSLSNSSSTIPSFNRECCTPVSERCRGRKIGDVAREGYLNKKEKLGIGREWRKRYVVVCGGKIVYYRSKEDFLKRVRSKSIDLKLVTVKIETGKNSSVADMIGGHSLVMHPLSSPQTENCLRTLTKEGGRLSTVSAFPHCELHSSKQNGSAFQISAQPSSDCAREGLKPAKSEQPGSFRRNLTDFFRPVKENTCNAYTFTLMSAANRKWVFQTNSRKEQAEWIQAIQSEIYLTIRNHANESQRSKTMNFDTTLQCPASSDNCGDVSRVQWSSSVSALHSLTTKSYISRIAANLREVAGNDVCADCSMKDPGWACINLGTLICTDCCSAHRKLGTHISRVKSIDLDIWPAELQMVMKSLGNQFANAIWEAHLHGFNKPTPFVDFSEKDAWVSLKYQEKHFIKSSEGTYYHELTARQFADKLAERIRLKNSRKLYEMMHTRPDPSKDYCCVKLDGGRNLVHVAAYNNDVVSLQLLIWHGMNVMETDLSELTPLDYAQRAGNQLCEHVLQTYHSRYKPLKSNKLADKSVNQTKNDKNQDNHDLNSEQYPTTTTTKARHSPETFANNTIILSGGSSSSSSTLTF